MTSARATFATGLCVAVIGAALACVPAALRTAADGVSFVAAWLALWGSSALLLGPAAAALRVARPLPRMAFAVPAALLVSMPVLIVFARILKTATHHRPLGAATFAVIAAGVVLGALAATGRLLSAEKGLARSVLIGWLALSALATLGLALPLFGSAPGSLLDAALVLAVAAAAVLVRAPPSLERVATIAGPLALLLAVVAGLALGTPPVRAAAASRAPVLSGPLL